MLISKFSNNAVEKRIADTEQRYHFTFPDQHKKFLLKYNGGYTPNTTFKAKGVSSDLRGFFGVGDVGLSLDNEPLKLWAERNLFPIACDSFGNLVVMGINDESSGKVFFCDHENGYAADFLAESLVDFLRCCVSEGISPESTRSVKEREDALIAKGRGYIITDALRKLWQDEIDKYSKMILEEVSID